MVGYSAPRPPRIIIQIIAPIISMHGTIRSAPAPMPLDNKTMATTAKATQPHIIFIECSVWSIRFIVISWFERGPCPVLTLHTRRGYR